MKTYSLTACAFAALSLAACNPAPSASDASSDSASIDASVSAVAEAPPVVADTAESVSSSAASVVVHTVEIYDAPTIDKVAAKPGYWQIARTDPQTHKRYLTKVCIDKDLGRRMAGERPQPPAGWHGGAPDASFLGACPASVHGGDVVNRDGSVRNAWGDHRDDHGASGRNTGPGDRNPVNPPAGDHHDASSSSDRHDQDRDHLPPGDGGAPGRPDSHLGQGADHGGASHSGDRRGH